MISRIPPPLKFENIHFFFFYMNCKQIFFIPFLVFSSHETVTTHQIDISIEIRPAVSELDSAQSQLVIEFSEKTFEQTFEKTQKTFYVSLMFFISGHLS